MQFPGWVRAHDHCYAEHIAGSGEDRDFHLSVCRDLELDVVLGFCGDIL